MKTYKTFGIAAAAWAALACMMPRSVEATPPGGDIWSVRQTDSEGYAIGNQHYSMDLNPLRVGDKVYFKFRMLNRDPQANVLARGSKASAETWNNHWFRKYTGGDTNNPYFAAAAETDWASNPLRVGVWLNNTSLWADYKDLGLAKDAQTGEYNYDYSDFICVYTVQPGDFGQLRLAGKSSTSANIVPASDPNLISYALENSDKWGVFDALTTTNACHLWMKPDEMTESTISTFVSFPNEPVGLSRWEADIDLSKAGELGVGDAYGVISKYCEDEKNR